MRLAASGIRRRRGWAFALLPVLLLRALVPAGFMPAIGAGSLALVFCEPAALAAPGAHGAHHHHGDDGGGRGPHSASGECPFAQSAAPALPAFAASPPAAPFVARGVAPWRDAVTPGSVPLRYAAPRGPPARS